MKMIMAATDLSARSDRAVHRALTLAHEHCAEIEVLHVLDADYPDDTNRELETSAVSKIRDQIASLGHSEERCRIKVVHGHDYVEIIRNAHELGADVIVLGVPRQTPSAYFKGTTAERVIRGGHVPVLVVREPVAQSYRVILVAHDLSIHSRRALSFAAEIAPQAEFHLVHATHEPFRAFLDPETIRELVHDEQDNFKTMIVPEIDTLKAHIKSHVARIELSFGAGLAETVIREKISEIRPDLLVIGTHGRTGIAHALLGSVAEGLLANSPVDVLAVKAF